MKIKKAVIPIAGKGTRFLPATKEVAKEMIPIINKPMIHYAVEEAVLSGITEIVFVTSKEKQSIEKYFQRNYVLEEFLEKNGKEKELALIKSIGTMIDFKTVEQEEQLGLGHAILCAEKFIAEGESFAVILGDDLVLSMEPVTKQLAKISAAKNGDSVIGVMQIENSQTYRYGIVDGEFEKDSDKTLKMNKMVEKPQPADAPTNLATPGRYILNEKIFKFLKDIPRGAGGEYQLTDAINLMAQNESMYAHIFQGDRFDTGNIEGYLNATVEFSLRNPETKKIMENIILEKMKTYNLG